MTIEEILEKLNKYQKKMSSIKGGDYWKTDIELREFLKENFERKLFTYEERKRVYQKEFEIYYGDLL